MIADAPKPIRRISRIRFLAVQDGVPVASLRVQGPAISDAIRRNKRSTSQKPLIAASANGSGEQVRADFVLE